MHGGGLRWPVPPPGGGRVRPMMVNGPGGSVLVCGGRGARRPPVAEPSPGEGGGVPFWPGGPPQGEEPGGAPPAGGAPATGRALDVVDAPALRAWVAET